MKVSFIPMLLAISFGGALDWQPANPMIVSKSARYGRNMGVIGQVDEKN